MNNSYDKKKELIHSCVVAGINRYMNEVLMPGGYINQTRLAEEGSGLGTKLSIAKHQIAESIASRLQHSENL